MSLTEGSAQTDWESIKQHVKSVARRFQFKQASWRQRTLKSLQRRRNRLIRGHQRGTWLLDRVEQQINNLQQEIAETEALRAGKIWREKGEKDAGFLKRTALTRETQRSVPALRDEVTDSIVSNNKDKSALAGRFYTALYRPDASDASATSWLLAHVPPLLMSTEEERSLLRPFSLDDIQDAARRSPRHSSPGVDGLPYELLSLILAHPDFQPIAISVYNSALLHGVMPPSWQQTCTSLLPKKGDLSRLKNWRPISLINTNAKVFTRLLNSRLTPPVLSHNLAISGGFHARTTHRRPWPSCQSGYGQCPPHLQGGYWSPT